MPIAHQDHHRQPSPRRLDVITRRHRQACLTAIGPDEIQRRFGGSADSTWAAVVAMDPADNHRHLQWVCRQVEGGKLKPEDFYKAAPLLQELRRTAPLLRASGITRDLNQYSGLPDLSAALRPFAEQLTAGEIDREERALVDSETIVHHRCEKLLVVEPKTKRASCFWGRGTQWCTAATESSNAFDIYTEHGGQLFIYILADGTKYQACTDGQMADAEDRSVMWANIKAEHQAAMLGSATLEDLAVIGEKSVLSLLRDSPRIEALCELATRQSAWALEHVPNDLITLEFSEAAVRQNGRLLQFVPGPLRTKEVCELAVRLYGWALRDVPERLKTPELCELAVRQDGGALHCVPNHLKTPELCELAVRQYGWALQDVPDHLKTRELCEIAVRKTGGALQYAPDHLVTPQLCELAVRAAEWALDIVPRHLITRELCELAGRQPGGPLHWAAASHQPSADSQKAAPLRMG